MDPGKGDVFSHKSVRCKLQGPKLIYEDLEYRSFMYIQAKI